MLWQQPVKAIARHQRAVKHIDLMAYLDVERFIQICKARNFLTDNTTAAAQCGCKTTHGLNVSTRQVNR